MEPFGILQFLQSLFSASSNPSQNTAQPQTRDEAPDEPVSPPLPEENNRSQDAILQFIESHEKRAYRIRNR